MVFQSRVQVIVCALLVVASSSAVLRSQPKDQAKVAPAAKESKAVVAEAASKPASKQEKTKPQSEAETLEALGKGLQTIHNLRSLFANQKADSSNSGAEKFANGALSEELSNKDSQVWSTIENMLGETKNAMTELKGKSKSDREKVMQSLESKLDMKAKVLSTVTDSVSKKQEEQDEEYLLGLLNLHRNDWSIEKQLNATQTFMHNSPLLRDFYQHHDASKPLVPQLAAMMDAKAKASTSKVQKASPEKPKATAQKKQAVAKAASSAAKALFIQLASTITQSDCPYCAAQCVDKCHQAGKPYVQCLTDCADAGKQ